MHTRKIQKGPFPITLAWPSVTQYQESVTEYEWWQGRLRGTQESHLRKPCHRLTERVHQQVLSGSTGANKRLPDNSPHNSAGWKNLHTLLTCHSAAWQAARFPCAMSLPLHYSKDAKRIIGPPLPYLLTSNKYKQNKVSSLMFNPRN